MASTDARPVAQKNVAFRLYFWVYDVAGDLKGSLDTPDSEIVKDDGAAADCTNEATATSGSPGRFYIDLTSTEMNADAVGYKLTTADSDVKPLTVDIYPEEAGDIRVDVTQISGDSTAADNLESMFDGTGYPDETGPSSRSQVDGIGASSGGSRPFEATEDNTGGAIKGATFVGVETSGTFASTEAEDGTYHLIDDTGNDIDIVYGFDVTGAFIATEVSFKGFLNGGNDDMLIQAYDFVGSDWETRVGLPGKNGSSNDVITAFLLSKHTGTGADLGKVYIRFEADGGMSNPDLNVDELIVSGVANVSNLGFIGAAVWVDTANGEAGTAAGVGTISRPSNNIEDAKTIADLSKLKAFQFLPGSDDDLSEAMDGYEFRGAAYSLGLGSQSIDGSTFINAIITGIGEATGTQPIFERCLIGAATIPPARLNNCGLGYSGGTFTAAADAGEYVFDFPYSLAPGAGTVTFDYSNVTGATGINMRGYRGGSTYTLNSDCTLSHEVLVGGGTTITTGGGDAEIRGICRDLTLTMSAAETVQFAGITGDITLNGTTTATVNLDGVAGKVTDSTSAATVTDQTVKGPNVNLILADTGELQTDWTDGGRLDLILDIIAADTTTDIPALIAALNDISTADVNAQVVDVIDTDTSGEPAQGAPGATLSLRAKIDWLYKSWRNKKTQTATTWSLFNDDAATVDSKATVSDDTTTATKGEIVSGP